MKVGTEENLKRQLDEERRRGERLNQRLLKAEADNARMSKIIGWVVIAISSSQALIKQQGSKNTTN